MARCLLGEAAGRSRGVIVRHGDHLVRRGWGESDGNVALDFRDGVELRFETLQAATPQPHAVPDEHDRKARGEADLLGDWH
jgi:hypothetical protein